MRRTLIVLIPFALLAAPVGGQDRPWHGERPGGLFRKGAGFMAKRLLGDVTPEQKEALKGIGKSFLEEARENFPQMRDAVHALLSTVQRSLTDDEKYRVKGVFAKLRSLSMPEKIGLARRFIGGLNDAEMRGKVKTFFKGASLDERQAAGDWIARAAARKFVEEVAERADVDDEGADAVLGAFDDFLSATKDTRATLRALAEVKLREAWGVLTPEQKDRIKGALRLLRGWLEAAAAPQAPTGG